MRHDVSHDMYLLQQKKRQKTLAKIKQLTEEEESDTRGVQQKGSSSRKRTQTKGGKDKAPKKTSGKKCTKENAETTKCSILPYFTVKK